MFTPITLVDRCYHPSAVEYTEPVNGYVTRVRCHSMRGYGGKCGVDPKLFEPIPQPLTFMQRIFNLHQHTK